MHISISYMYIYCCKVYKTGFSLNRYKIIYQYIYIWPFPKIPCPAKRVASGGMIRGMFRRYVSGVCFGVCFALPFQDHGYDSWYDSRV